MKNMEGSNNPPSRFGAAGGAASGAAVVVSAAESDAAAGDSACAKNTRKGFSDKVTIRHRGKCANYSPNGRDRKAGKSRNSHLPLSNGKAHKHGD